MKSYPELKAIYRFHLPVVVTVEICLRGANMRMAHERLNRSKIIPIIQKGRGKRMPHHVGMDPLLDQSFFYHGFDETVNGCP